MVVLIGIPGAGKSTVREQMFSGHAVVSLDILQHKTRNDEDKLLIELCESGVDIVVDGANIDKVRRMGYLRFAREYGYHATALFVDTSLDAALARNELRERKVPEGAIRSYCRNLEVPEMSEGWDYVFTIWNIFDPRRVNK